MIQNKDLKMSNYKDLYEVIAIEGKTIFKAKNFKEALSKDLPTIIVHNKKDTISYYCNNDKTYRNNGFVAYSINDEKYYSIENQIIGDGEKAKAASIIYAIANKKENESTSLSEASLNIIKTKVEESTNLAEVRALSKTIINNEKNEFLKEESLAAIKDSLSRENGILNRFIKNLIPDVQIKKIHLSLILAGSLSSIPSSVFGETTFSNGDSSVGKSLVEDLKASSSKKEVILEERNILYQDKLNKLTRYLYAGFILEGEKYKDMDAKKKKEILDKVKKDNDFPVPLSIKTTAKSIYMNGTNVIIGVEINIDAFQLDDRTNAVTNNKVSMKLTYIKAGNSLERKETKMPEFDSNDYHLFAKQVFIYAADNLDKDYKEFFSGF